MSKYSLGDVFVLKTSKGNVFLHFVYTHKLLGDLVRVLPGFYKEQLVDIEKLTRDKELFLAYFPVTVACKRAIVEKVGTVDLTAFEPPKFMRTRSTFPGRKSGWFIVDTHTLKREFIKELSEEHKRLSPWGTCNDTKLIERLENGFTLDGWI